MTWLHLALLAPPVLGITLYVLAPQIWRWATGRDPFTYYDSRGRARW